MIELTLCDGSPVTINSTAIGYFHPAEDHAIIHLVNGSVVTGRETYDQLSEIFNPDRQDGC